MSLKLIFYTLGNLLICLAGTMLFPIGVGIYYQTAAAEVVRTDLRAFVISLIITLVAGLILRFGFRARQAELGIREGFAVVAMGWVTVALFGALPYLLAGVFHSEGTLVVDSVRLLLFRIYGGIHDNRCNRLSRD